MKLSKATLRKRILERVKERARLVAAQEFEKDFNEWRKEIFPLIKKGDFTKFWFPMHILCAKDLSSWFTRAQFALGNIFDQVFEK